MIFRGYVSHNQMVYIHCWNAQKENTSTHVEQNAPSISKVQPAAPETNLLRIVFVARDSDQKQMKMIVHQNKWKVEPQSLLG